MQGFTIPVSNLLIHVLICNGYKAILILFYKEMNRAA